jgi:hypothetical protein
MNRLGRVVLVSFLLSAFAISSAVVLARGATTNGSNPSITIEDECPGCPFGRLSHHKV